MADPTLEGIDLEKDSTAVLEERYLEFARKAGGVKTEFDAAYAAFETTEGRFVLIFERLAVIEETMSISLGLTPGETIPDEWDFDVAGVSSVTVGASVGVVWSLIKILRAIGKYRAASQTVTLSTAAIAATNVPNATLMQMMKIKNIRGWAIAGAGFALITSGAALAMKIRGDRARRTFYVRNLPVYEDWFRETRQNIAILTAATAEMEEDIEGLRVQLGYETFEEMREGLAGAVTKAGEFEALIATATRMLCDGLDAGDVATYTGLPTRFVTRRAEQIGDDPTICSAS